MRLHTFGRLAIEGDDASADARLQRRQLALLAVLAAEGTAGVTRDRLLGLFAADREPEKARHSLDQMLYAIRRVIGAEALRSGPVSLELDAALVSSDVGDFIAAIGAGDARAAVGSYRGAFLDGVFIADAPEFERWLEGRRSYFAGAFVKALARLAEEASAASDHAEAVGHLRRATAVDPLSAALTDALMRALVRTGDVSAALSVARVHASMVREQLDADPDPRITALEEDLRAGRTERAPVAPIHAREAGGDAATAGSRALPAALPSTVRPRSRAMTVVVAIAGVTMAAAILWSANQRAGRRGYLLRDLTQLTVTGHTRTPAISPDGKYIAYASRDCDSAGRCHDALEIQEIGGTAARRLIEHARGIEYLAWSPDSRNLLLYGSVGDREGFHIISTIGGSARYLTPRYSAFFAGGDSLFIFPAQRVDSVLWLAVAGIDGATRDSVAIAGTGATGTLDEMVVVPGSPWIVVAVRRKETEEVRVIDRHGREVDRRRYPDLAQNVRATTGALWLSFPQGSNSVITRIAVDPATGHLAAAVDTLYVGVFSDFDLTATGDRLVVDQAAFDQELWVLDFRDAVRGNFAAARSLLRSSSGLDGDLSPDGAYITAAEELGSVPGGGWRLELLPYEGGVARPVAVKGKPIGMRWPAPDLLALGEEEGDTTRFVSIDPASGLRRSEFALPVSGVHLFAPLRGGGWAWVAPDRQSLRVRRPSDRETLVFPKPPWLEGVYDVNGSPDGGRVAYWGFSMSRDSMRVSVLSLADSSTVDWWTQRAPLDALVDWFDDGSLRLRAYEHADSLVFSRLRVPGRIEALGTIRRRTRWASVSQDMRRALLITREPRGDVWMQRVVAP